MVNIETHHRLSDPEPVRITREIPLAWLIGVSAGLLVQAVTLYIGQQTQAEAIRALSAEVKELRVMVQAGNLKDVEYGLRIDDHERRLTIVENSPEFRAARTAADEAARSRNGGAR